MCGRFTLAVDLESLRTAFPWLTIPALPLPRYNIAPTQAVAVVPNNGKKELDFFTWGLIPSWAKDPKIGSRMINARSETLGEKPSFRAAYRRRRCLILADGFYEWSRERLSDGRDIRTPIYVRLESGRPFAFGGLWEYWQSAEGDEVYSCTIITVPPNDLLKPIHDRMPLILAPALYDGWLDQEEKLPEELDDYLTPYPAELMVAYPVSTLVNSLVNDLPACIEPV
jgi:putative SOS response-associated peptidase YedK